MFGERWKDFSKMPKAYAAHGIIQHLENLGTSADETRYLVTLVPKIADLNRARKSRLLQKQSVCRNHNRHIASLCGYRLGVDFDFKNLRGKYKCPRLPSFSVFAPKNGFGFVDHRPGTTSYRLEPANGVSYNIPVSDQFRGDLTNGQLANQGFHFSEQGPDGDGEGRAIHRRHYFSLLNPDTNEQHTES